jgi:hypothetical protein
MQRARGAIDPGALIGVAVAAVVAMALSPEPYDWWSTMIGIALLAVLVGYGHWPLSWREAVGFFAVVGLVVLYIIGRPIESWLDFKFSGETDEGVPRPGDWALAIWAGLAVMGIVVWALAERFDLPRRLNQKSKAGAPNSERDAAGGPQPRKPV